MSRSLRRRLVVTLGLGTLLAVPAPTQAAGTASGGCDPIGSPAACLLPFPNDYFTVPSAKTATGREVRFTRAMMPRNVAGIPVDPREWNRNDGFSPGAGLLVHVPGVNLGRTKAAPITDMGRSLRGDAPIVILNTRTGQRHPYWAELDSTASSKARQLLIVRPARSFDEGTRYVVALRAMRDSAGEIIAPRPAFAAMLASTPPAEPKLRHRWYSLRPVFADLAKAGIGARGLYLAWDFTVASTRNLTERMLHIRDEAFARLGTAAPKVTITQITDFTAAQDSRVARKVEGVVGVPNYLNVPGGPPGSRLNYSWDGKPEPLSPRSEFQARFACVIPRTALRAPARPVLLGHGLFGDESTVDSGFTKASSIEHNLLYCATRWTGMSREDVPFLVSFTADMSRFPAVPDRLQQSYLNFLFLGRAMIHPRGLSAHPAFRDPSKGSLLNRRAELAYEGHSLGGIEGAGLTAVAQDFTRAVLGVPAINFSLLLNRSSNFTFFQRLFDQSYPDRLDQQILYQLMQMLWDRGEGNGYAHHLTRSPLPNTPVHRVLLHEVFGDHQVANVATEVQARTIGAYVHQPALAAGRSREATPMWGIPAIPSYPFAGSALVMWDSGAPPPPRGNVTPRSGHDPHGDVRNTPSARRQAAHFLITGTVIDVCAQAPCRAIPTG